MTGRWEVGWDVKDNRGGFFADDQIIPHEDMMSNFAQRLIREYLLAGMG
jgi:hypothetical protein